MDSKISSTESHAGGLLRQQFNDLLALCNQKIVGQGEMAERMVLALLSGGHVILQGPPGVAKTRTARVVFYALEGVFKRIQFTPDLLPADIIGGSVYNSNTQEFEFRRGPLFANFVLADEINRAPAKVQSALLEAMEEGQVTSGEHTFKLEPPFFVAATQNPIEHDGTWDLPQAQLDRFMLQITIDYPSSSGEKDILDLLLEESLQGERDPVAVEAMVSHSDLLAAQQCVRQVHIAQPVRAYIVRLISGLRAQPIEIEGVTEHLSHPASSRGSIMLAAIARARAWLDGRDYVVPEDVTELAVCVLSHRIGLTYRSEAEGVQAIDVIKRLIEQIDVV